MQLAYIATSKNGYEVIYDPVHSHAATHIEDTPQLLDLAKEVIPKLELSGNDMGVEKDMGRIVGKTDGVETTEADEIIYAKRKNRDTYTRFTKSQQSQPSSLVSLYFIQLDGNTYELSSAWIGELDSPPFPGDENETPESRPYWAKHALVWGNQEVQPATVTTECPWN